MMSDAPQLSAQLRPARTLFTLLVLTALTALTAGGCTSTNPDYLPKDRSKKSPRDRAPVEQPTDQRPPDSAPEPDLAPPADQRPPADQAPSPDQTPIIDEDGDGRSADEDCDDQNPDVFPQAFEFCDGIDNDCDDTVDEIYPRLGAPCAAGRGSCGAEGSWRCSDDLRGVVCDATPLPPGEEICDQLDNDCDGTSDESLDCRCEPSEEVCDEIDNDCDRQVDEGVRNDCGLCGAVPDERCNRFDDDCDGFTDEGLLNACGDCGPTPVERCDGADNDCDDEIDEGAENGCGGCGRIAPEQCDQADNDCDGEIDEGFERACAPICVPREERCNGADDDCDGVLDERLDEPCVVLIATSELGRAGGHLGSALANAGDLNDDGIPDVYVGAPGFLPDELEEGEASTPGRVYALDGQSGAVLWQLNGEGGFGYQLASGDWNGDGSRDLAVGAPLVTNTLRQEGSVFLYGAGGAPIRSINPSASGGIGRSVRSARLAGGDALVLGEPLRSVAGAPRAGRLSALRFDAINPQDVELVLRLGGNREDQRLSALIHPVQSVDDDPLDELIISQRGDDGGRETLLYLTESSELLGPLSAPVADQQSFGDAVIDGLFEGREQGRRYAFGAPLVREGGTNGQLFMIDEEGAIYDERRFVEDGERQGHALARCPRPTHDALFVGGMRSERLILVDFVEGENWIVHRGAIGVGYALLLSRVQSADGSWRLFVGSPMEADGRGRLLIFSVR